MAKAELSISVTDLPRVREYLDRVVAEAVNEAAASLRKIREWCDRTEAETREWMTRHNPDCECEVGETYLNAVEEVRSLLPPVPEAAEEVNPLGIRVTRGDDRDLSVGGSDSGN